MTNMWKEITEQPEILTGCLDSNLAVMEQIIADIKKSNIHLAVIAARGTSDHAAVYGKYVFEILTGLPVSLAAPSVFTMYNGGMKFENTLVIGVSQSGKASDVAEVIKAANAHNAITVTITNFPDSPLAKVAKYHLCCNAGEEKSVAATKTFTTEMYLLGNLAARLAGNTELTKEYAGVPDQLRRTFALTKDMEQVVSRYRFMKECFVLARGINYPVALETALKIQETCYIRAKAFATSDFHHGPKAMIERDMPVIVYAPKGPSLSDVREMTDTVKEAGGDVLMVSDVKEFRDMGSCSIAVPDAVSDFTSPFCNAAVAQMFACHLSLLKGLNPDQPRMLRKVTITR